MSLIVTDNIWYTKIAQAIRRKKKVSTQYDPSQMEGAIDSIAPTLQERTVAPTTSSQDVVPQQGYEGLSKVTVSGIVATSRTVTPGKTTTTYTPNAGTFYSQVIVNGDANLDAANIISGRSIFGVDGGVVIQKYYTGSGTPANSLGNNGDIYLRG